MLHDAPCLGRITMVRWLKRMWRCREPACPIGVFSETRDIAPPRWATDALAHDDTTVSALARHLGVDWHTAWNAIEIEAKARTGDPQRLTSVKPLGWTSTFGGPAESGSIGPSPSWLI
jgi:transposase